MTLISWIFALAKSFLDIPTQYQIELKETESECQRWYSELDNKEGMLKSAKQNFFGHPIFKLVLLCLYNPVGRWLQNVGKPKEEDETSLKDLISELDKEQD